MELAARAESRFLPNRVMSMTFRNNDTGVEMDGWHAWLSRPDWFMLFYRMDRDKGKSRLQAALAAWREVWRSCGFCDELSLHPDSWPAVVLAVRRSMASLP